MTSHSSNAVLKTWESRTMILRQNLWKKESGVENGDTFMIVENHHGENVYP